MKNEENNPPRDIFKTKEHYGAKTDENTKIKRRTKIVATLGPATDDPDVLHALFVAGVNVVRLNFSHGSIDAHRNRVEQVRALSKQLDRNVAILGDLQGPKIRISGFKQDKVVVKEGDYFILDTQLAADQGDELRVGLTYSQLPRDCKQGDTLLLDDGRIAMDVVTTDAHQIKCVVTQGGELSASKGINLKGGGLSAPALTQKDREDIKATALLELDYMAVSFPRSMEDMQLARKLLRESGGKAALVSKIERAEVVNDHKILREVIRASDAVMVARGDLGVEIGDAELIGVQKRIIRESRQLNKPVITATQMMESMITSRLPTRAEVFDVANAVLDGTDAVMLSAESAMGSHPGIVVDAMNRICLGAEKEPVVQLSTHRMEFTFQRTDETIAMAAMYAANHMNGVKAIICLTESGSTPLWMSRINSSLPIFALTRHEYCGRLMSLYRGVESLIFDPTSCRSSHEIYEAAINVVKETGYLVDGDRVLITKGDLLAVTGESNTLKILTV